MNPTVGDVAGNRGLIAAAYEEASGAGADLVVTPELSLVGYPPRDLLHRNALLDACEEALPGLAAMTADGPALVVGTPVRHGGPGRPPRNVAAVCADGRVVARGAKRIFPTYDVFDRVLTLLHRSEYKRWQSAPLLRVTEQAFGTGWHYPLAARYDELRGR